MLGWWKWTWKERETRRLEKGILPMRAYRSLQRYALSVTRICLTVSGANTKQNMSTDGMSSGASSKRNVEGLNTAVFRWAIRRVIHQCRRELRKDGTGVAYFLRGSLGRKGQHGGVKWYVRIWHRQRTTEVVLDFIFNQSLHEYNWGPKTPQMIPHETIHSLEPESACSKLSFLKEWSICFYMNLAFENGASKPCDFLIGADGLKIRY